MQAPESATVLSIIEKVLRMQSEGKLLHVLPYSEAACYEMRLHEEDGYPDEDVPALDSHRQLSQFGGTEYCMCVRSDARAIQAELHGPIKTVNVTMYGARSARSSCAHCITDLMMSIQSACR